MPPTLPATLPELPETDTAWSHHVQAALEILSKAYHAALQILQSEDGDALRLRHHSQRIIDNIVPILEALATEGLPNIWVESCARVFGGLMVELEKAAAGVEQEDQARLKKLKLVQLHRSGRRGRPEKIINPVWLSAATQTSRRINMETIAALLGMHQNTLRKKLREAGVYQQFTDLSNNDLDMLLRVFKRRRPESGLSYIVGFLSRHGVRVQRARLRGSYNRVDGLGKSLRRNEKTQRREYTSPRPNFCWHCDGHHKLIKWGFVIHGFIDGYCRTVTGLHASTNNRASTVFEVFMKAVEEFGVPSRVRGDRGGENVRVAVWMIMHQGTKRGSFMWGSSTRNTRIECLWVEVGTQFAWRWRAFFTRLEELHQLDSSNQAHLWLLHHLFLDLLNTDCEDFQKEWNLHPLSGPGPKGRSPSELRFLGETMNGKPVDELTGIHPDTLHRYCGTHGQPQNRNSHQTGAGHPADESSGDESDTSDSNSSSGSLSDAEGSDADEYHQLQERITSDLRPNINHKPVKVPRHQNPFEDLDPAFQASFKATLQHIKGTGFVPEGYGLLPDEWENETYPSFEQLKVGRKEKKLTIELPEDIWYPRAVAWAQGLYVMNQLLYELEDFR